MKAEILTVTLNPAIDWTVSVAEFAVGEVNRAGREMTGAGGKGVNVATVLADFGLNVAVTGFLGRQNDESFRQLFARRGIEDRMIRLEGPTRVGIKIVDDACGETTDINFPGLTPAPADLAKLATAIEEVNARWVVFAGSVPPGVDSGIYRKLIFEARRLGCKVALDTSGEALKLALEGPRETLPHLIKPNLAELEELVGAKFLSPSEILDAARLLLARGIQQLAVSLGGEGMLLVTESEAVWAQPPEIDVGSTVGAGDALLAGLIAAETRRFNPTERARLAVAFSSEVLTRSGEYGISKLSLDAWEREVMTRSILPARGSPNLPPVQNPLRQNAINGTTHSPFAKSPA